MKYPAIVSVVSLGAVLLTGCANPAPAQSETSTSQSSSLPTLSSSSAGTASATPSLAPPSGSNGTIARPFDIGAFGLSGTGSRWDVTITETIPNGTEVVIAENPYNETKEGWQYAVGRMTSVLNQNLRATDTGKPVSPASVMPIFIGSDGRIYDIWNDDNSAVVLTEDWIGQNDIIAQIGIRSTGRFAIQVPTAAVAGGRFATRNEVSGDIVYFGAPI